MEGGPNDGFVKGVPVLRGGGGLGTFVGEESRLDNGANGIRVGDGNHDYLIVGIVSCNHANLNEVRRWCLLMCTHAAACATSLSASG